MGLGRAERDRTGDDEDDHRGCRDRSPWRAVAPPLGRRGWAPGVLPLLVERAHDAIPKIGRRLLGVHRTGERPGPPLQLHPLLPPGAAPPRGPPELAGLLPL